MSTDYSAMCFKCKEYMHAGQRMANSYSFAYGGGDDDEMQDVAAFMFKHVECGPVLIVYADDVPSTFENVDP